MNIPNLRSRCDRAVRVVFLWLVLFFGAGTGVNAANLTFAVGTTNGVTNAPVVVPIRVSHFTGISSFQFSLHWNTNLASFVGVEQFGLPGLAANNDSFGTTLTSTGTLTVLWIDPLGAPATVADDTMIFAVRLKLVGPAAATTSVIIDGNPTAIVAGDQVGAAVPVTVVNGTLNIDRTLIVACTANKTVECGSAWSFDPPSATDSCGGLPVTINVISTVTNAGPCGFTATRMWEVLDPCANRTTCVQTVTAVDTMVPVVTCAPNKTVECGSAWSFNAPTAMDNCVGPNVTINIVSTVTNTTGTCGSIATRTWEILDPCLNRSTCVQVVTVVDTTAPAVTCAPNKTVECGSAWSFNAPTATDNCSAVTINVVSTVTNTTATCGSTAMRTWEILDPCLNRSTCVQIVTVADTTAPAVTCAPNKTVECGSAWSFNAPTATDNCSGSAVTINIVGTVTNTTATCGSTATRTWEILDPCLNRSTCVQVVTVVDTTAPVATCAPNKTVECGSAWNFDAPTATDNCSAVTINVISTVTNLGPCGFTATRMWEVLDPCANRTTCVQTVTAVDTMVPVVTCAPNKTVECGSAWSFNAPTAMDNCSGSAVTINIVSTVTNTMGTCGATATRTWEILDPCLNRSTCVQVVTVVDTTAPAVTCAPNKTVECGSAWSFNAPTATDNCVGPSVTINIVSTVTNTTGTCGSTATRTWEILDACANRSTCVQIVTVADTTAPAVTCAPSKTVECGSAWSFNAPTATDNCSGSAVTINIVSTVTNTTGTCGATATRTWEILDPCLNRSTCVQVVTVVDTTAPVATCAPNKTVECGSAWNFDAPTATDNCVGPSLTIRAFNTVTNMPGTCGYTATRTWEILDACTNRSTCVQIVTVIDTTPPVATCTPNKTVEFGQAWNFDTPTGTDSCAGVNVTIQILTTVASANCGTTLVATRTWEISDGCSNKVNCTQTVTVRDTTAPVITCAPDKAVNCLAAWIFDTPTAIDVASGESATVTMLNTVTNGTCGTGFTATRTWRATDSCGNSATCSQTVSGQAIVSVSGTVYSPTNYPATMTDKRVAGATVLGPTSIIGNTAADGSYSFVFDAASNVVITPLPPSGGNPADGVGTLGISLIRRHILAVSNLNTPYKLLAADVDGSGSISTLDLSFIRRLILGTTNRFPAGLWRFVPANFVFPNALNPWNAPTNQTYGGVASDLMAQDFVAIKLGDVNHSWTPPVGVAGFKSATAKDGSSVVSFEVNGATNLPGSSVVVQVTVGGFSEVTSVQGTLTWDPAVIRFTGMEAYGLNGLSPDNFGTNQVSTGKLVFSWDDPAARGVTAPDGTAIFAPRFDVIGTMGSVSPVALLDSIAMREVGVNFAPAIFRAIDGQVRVMEPPPLRLSQVAFIEGTFAVTVPTLRGKRYILEYTDNLPAASWTALPPMMGDGKVNILSDPAPSPLKRFYRVRVE